MIPTQLEIIVLQKHKLGTLGNVIGNDYEKSLQVLEITWGFISAHKNNEMLSSRTFSLMEQNDLQY